MEKGRKLLGNYEGNYREIRREIMMEKMREIMMKKGGKLLGNYEGNYLLSYSRCNPLRLIHFQRAHYPRQNTLVNASFSEENIEYEKHS